jgi:transglutaminase-like putative cysteine protease
MIREAVDHDITRLSWIDYSLMGAGSCLAVFAAAMSVGSESLAWIFTGIVIFGSLASCVAQAFLSERTGNLVGGVIYAVIVVLVFFQWRNINLVLPDQVFNSARELSPAGFLVWMIMLGSFACWRDQTLLFQAVPAIAIFGLVGCYDTYRYAPFLFFGFLLCLSTMFARAHARSMLAQAAASGYRQRIAVESASSGRPADGSRWANEIRNGPWRWVAGPEWALASAATVVVVSLVGAPVLQESVKGVSGFVKFTVPVPQNRPANTPSLISTGIGGGQVGIGRGPNRLRDTPVLRAKMDEPHYLRINTFLRYNGRGWDAVENREFLDVFDRPMPTIGADALKQIKDPKPIEFEVEVIGPVGESLPVPGEVTNLDTTGLPTNTVTQRADGTYSLNRMPPGGLPPVRGKSVIASNTSSAKYAISSPLLALDAASSTERVSEQLQQLVLSVTKNGTSDYEKARLWKREVERRCKYNLNAAATPEGEDPVDYFLFKSNEGYCDLFASSMALGSRVLNIPTRFVTGLAPDPAPEEDGRYLLREQDYHAWAELYFEDVGWVTFDATEGATAVPGGERGQSNVGKEWWRAQWVSVLGGMTAAAALALAGRKLGVMWQASRVLVDPNTRRLRRQYAIFTGVLAKAIKRPRMPGQTLSEYVAEAGPLLNGHRELAAKINILFEDALYGPAVVASENLLEIERLVQLFKRKPKD